MTDRFSVHEVVWSEWLESVRKDIECFFGILKARFRFLRNCIQHHDPAVLEAAFHTACIIHNMLHSSDGMSRFDWHSFSPDDDNEEEILLPAEEESPIVRPAPLLHNFVVTTTMEHDPTNNHHTLRSALCTHCIGPSSSL